MNLYITCLDGMMLETLLKSIYMEHQEDKEYRRSLGPEAHSRKPDSAEKNN